MADEDRIDPLGAYRAIRPVREGSVFAKYRLRKKPKKKEEKSERKTSGAEEKTSEHKVDIGV